MMNESLYTENFSKTKATLAYIQTNPEDQQKRRLKEKTRNSAKKKKNTKNNIASSAF